MHRIADVVADDLAHVGVQRGGVAHGLAGAGKRSDDAADGGQKAHVQHAVDFVEHQHLDRADGDGAAAEEVFEPAGLRRRGAGRASWSSWVFSLRPPTTSTASFFALGTSFRVMLQHLHGKLARGQQDERADGAALALDRRDGVGVHVLDHGTRKLSVLPVPVAARGQNVRALERGRNRLGLHRGRVMKPAALRQRFSASEILKSLKWTFFRKGRWVAGSISISEESTMAVDGRGVGWRCGVGFVVRRRARYAGVARLGVVAWFIV